MTDDELLGLQHTMEKADEDLTALTAEVEKLKRENADLRSLHDKEIADLRDLIHSLAAVTKIAETIFVPDRTGGEAYTKGRWAFSDGLAQIYTKTDPR